MQKAIGIIGGLLVFAGIALIPLDPVTVPFPAQLAAAVTGLMVIWWITEAIPIYATALVPLVLFPLLGILSPDCRQRSRMEMRRSSCSWAGSLLPRPWCGGTFTAGLPST